MKNLKDEIYNGILPHCLNGSHTGYATDKIMELLNSNPFSVSATVGEDEINKFAKEYAKINYGEGYYPDVEKSFIAGFKKTLSIHANNKTEGLDYNKLNSLASELISKYSKEELEAFIKQDLLINQTDSVEFAEWCNDNCVRFSTGLWQYKNISVRYTTKELYAIYQKEKING